MKSVANISLAALTGFLFSTFPTLAVPLPRSEKTTITGTIVDWIWRGEIHYQEESQGVAFQHTIPSHYTVRIKIEGKRGALLDTITLYSRKLPIGTGMVDDDLGNDEVLVYLPTSRLAGLLIDAKLTIEGYSIAADDSGPVAESSKILINGKTPKKLGPVFKEQPKQPSKDAKER